jgi:hypothetical protein
MLNQRDGPPCRPIFDAAAVTATFGEGAEVGPHARIDGLVAEVRTFYVSVDPGSPKGPSNTAIVAVCFTPFLGNGMPNLDGPAPDMTHQYCVVLCVMPVRPRNTEELVTVVFDTVAKVKAMDVRLNHATAVVVIENNSGQMSVNSVYDAIRARPVAAGIVAVDTEGILVGGKKRSAATMTAADATGTIHHGSHTTAKNLPVMLEMLDKALCEKRVVIHRRLLATCTGYAQMDEDVQEDFMRRLRAEHHPAAMSAHHMTPELLVLFGDEKRRAAIALLKHELRGMMIWRQTKVHPNGIPYVKETWTGKKTTGGPSQAKDDCVIAFAQLLLTASIIARAAELAPIRRAANIVV